MRVLVLAALVAAAPPAPARAAAIDPPQPPNVAALVDGALLAELRGFLGAEIVTLSVRNQNLAHGALDQAAIDALDAQWRSERTAAEKPLIATTLSRPLSSYLTRIQAQSRGLIVEAFVMDAIGLNVGQSSITSDYWQGDEDKWRLTFLKGAGGLFVDAPEFDDAFGVWRVQVNIAVARAGEAIGAATFELNLSELARRRAVQ